MCAFALCVPSPSPSPSPASLVSSSASCLRSNTRMNSLSFVSSALLSKCSPSHPPRHTRHFAPLSISNDKEGQTEEKIPFGYTRKDVILIGVGITAAGVGLKYGLEFVGVDPLKAGNVVQLVMVLGLTLGWISTYVFRVSTKEMTYAKQLQDYENKVMQKRLEELPEAELETLLAKVEEEKLQLKLSQEKLSQSE